MLRGNWWPFGLLIAGALTLWGLGYQYQNTSAIIFMAGLIAAAGAYVLLVQRQSGRKP